MRGKRWKRFQEVQASNGFQKTGKKENQFPKTKKKNKNMDAKMRLTFL